ncbi:MAG: carboxypeptidase regulatory-like domain-containing protein [Planctomycetes bacterium]|nr:carboxypeptidase regulatory-like domain-containing protein [Planctomycetota bacterium]
MSNGRRLALSLLAVLIAVPVTLMLLPGNAHAPELVHDPLPCGQSTQPRNTDGPLDLADPEPKPEPPRQPKPDDSCVLRMRLVDAATDAPIGDTPARLVVIEQGESEPDLDPLPERDDGNWPVNTVSNAEGEVTYRYNLSVAGLRDKPTVVLAIPQGWFPADPLEDYQAAWHSWVSGDLAVPVTVRFRRGLQINVKCSYEDGTPAEGVRVTGFPTWSDESVAFELRRDSMRALDALADQDAEQPPPLDQSGKGSPEGVEYEFISDEPTITGPPPPPEWQAATDERGRALIFGLPAGLTHLVIHGLGALKQVRTFELAADIEETFTIPRTANVDLTVRWLDDMPMETQGYRVLNVFGGSLRIYHGGRAEVRVSLTGIAPGGYECESMGNPTNHLWLEPGANAVTVWLGKKSFCDWYATLRVNGRDIPEFELKCQPKGGRTIHENAEFAPDTPCSMDPGVYIVDLPDGRTEEMHFVPGPPVYTRLDIKVREVTFTMGQDLHNLLTRPDEERPDGGISLTGMGDGGAAGLLAEALANDLYGQFQKLAPGIPVTLPMPPGVYDIWPQVPGHFYVFNVPLDVSDPSVNAVHLGLDGWPGAARYSVRFLTDADGNKANLYLDDSAWNTDHAIYDEDGWFGWFTPGGAACSSWGDRIKHCSAWLPVAREYRVDPASISGGCTVTLTDEDETESIDAWVRWTRDGIEFSAVWQGKEKQATQLPAGPVQLVVRRDRWREEVVHCAVLDLQLTGEHTVSLADLDWRAPGFVRVLGLGKIDVDLYSFGGERCKISRSPEGKVSTDEISEALPPGDYHLCIEGHGSLEIRTVTVRAGQTTTVDLR